MKKILATILLLAMALSLCAACQEQQNREITCAEVISAYEEAGYQVFHWDYPEKEYGYICSVRIEEEDGDSIEFHFHETDGEAEVEAEERQWNMLLWLFSAIYGEATWLNTETYRNIEIEYDDKNLYEPFKELIE